MKFTQVANGAQFEYKGAIYTKSGPLMAVDETGASKMLPRSADVTPLTGAIATKPPTDINSEMNVLKVISTFEAFYAQCQACFQEVEGKIDPQTLKQMKAELERARQKFIDKLMQ